MRWLLVLFTLMSVASAAVSVGIVAHINGDVVGQNTTATITNDGAEPLASLALTSGYKLFMGKPLPNDTMYLDEPLAPGNTTQLSFAVDAPGLVTRASDHELFSASFEVPVNTSYYSFSLVLPAGYSVKQSDGSPGVYPQASFASDGQSVIVVWEGVNVTAGEPLSFIAKYEHVAQQPAGLIEKYVPIVDTSLFLPGIILAFLFGYFLSAGIVSAIMRQVKRIRVNLSADEKMIVHHLEKHGAAEQSSLVRDLDFSKAKLSRVLREMEVRGLVKRTPRGKANIISLK
jgi:uncharacterized membrane protein